MKSDRTFLLEEKYGGIETPGFFEDCKRLEQGEPVAYIIGWVPFLGVKIFLDSRPLIPRPETEFWTEHALQALDERKEESLRCLDLFAGSGAIGIALLHHLPHSQVVFGELEERHFESIKKSIREAGINPSRVTTTHTDVFKSMTGTFDVILANPPYLSEERLERLEPSVLAFEPREALFADNDGYALIERTLSGLKKHLLPDGIAYIEHEPEHAQRIRDDGQKLGFLVETEKDQFGVKRFSILRAMA